METEKISYLPLFTQLVCGRACFEPRFNLNYYYYYYYSISIIIIRLQHTHCRILKQHSP